MKIGIDIHTVGEQQTGNETYIRNLVNQFLAREDPEVDYYLYQTKKHSLPEHWAKAHIHSIVPHTPALRIPLSFPLALWKNKVDVALFQYVCPPVSHCPMVTMVHDISFEYFPEFFNPISRKRMQTLIPFSARKSQHVLTVSEYSKRQIVEKYGIDEEKISVTYNGVSDAFRPVDDSVKDNIKEIFSLTRPFMLAVGNLQPRKNIERLVRVYAQLRRAEVIDMDLVLVGQLHWQGHAILDEITKNNVADFVKVTGYVSEAQLVALYNAAELFVYPSLYEGFGLPIIESMACRTPVITSNVSSMPEVAGDAAILIEPESDDSLKQAITRLANNEKLRQELVDKSSIQIKKFDWTTTAESTLSILKSVAGA